MAVGNWLIGRRVRRGIFRHFHFDVRLPGGRLRAGIARGKKQKCEQSQEHRRGADFPNSYQKSTSPAVQEL